MPTRPVGESEPIPHPEQIRQEVIAIKYTDVTQGSDALLKDRVKDDDGKGSGRSEKMDPEIKVLSQT